MSARATRPAVRLVQGACLALLLIVVGAGAARAGAAEDRLFREANAAYVAGKYGDARQRYEQIVQQGVVNERLFYNLGNAYFRQGQLGRAIWAYERALKIRPDLPEAAHNLQLARDEVQRKVKDKIVGARTPAFRERLVRYFSVTSATVAFYVLWYLAFGLLLAVLLLRRGVVRSLLIVVTVVAGLAASTFGWIYQARIDLDDHTREAVALEDKVAVREGPRGIATKAFEIHAGLKVRLIAREEQWRKIRLPNGLEGWVRADQLGEL